METERVFPALKYGASKLNKIHSVESLVGWVEAERLKGSKIGFTCGVFDILHAGHVEYLSSARALCDCLIVAVNSDESVKAYKNPLRPVVSHRERMIVVAGLAAVDAVVLLEDVRPAALIELLKPDIYIKGGDYSTERLSSKALVESYGGKVAVIPIEHATSTSNILARATELSLYEKPSTPVASDRRVVFLDRDGTLIQDVPFLHEPERVQLLPGVSEGLAELQALGFSLVMVTNQQGIGLGYYSVDDFIAVNRALFKQLSRHGISIARVYFCPHSVADGCDCRKPKPGLLKRAVRHFAAEPDSCYMLGDSLCDIQAASAAGIRGILVGSSAVPNSSGMSSFADAVAKIRAELRNAKTPSSAGVEFQST